MLTGVLPPEKVTPCRTSRSEPSCRIRRTEIWLLPASVARRKRPAGRDLNGALRGEPGPGPGPAGPERRAGLGRQRPVGVPVEPGDRDNPDSVVVDVHMPHARSPASHSPGGRAPSLRTPWPARPSPPPRQQPGPALPRPACSAARDAHQQPDRLGRPAGAITAIDRPHLSSVPGSRAHAHSARSPRITSAHYTSAAQTAIRAAGRGPGRGGPTIAPVTEVRSSRCRPLTALRPSRARGPLPGRARRPRRDHGTRNTRRHTH